MKMKLFAQLDDQVDTKPTVIAQEEFVATMTVDDMADYNSALEAMHDIEQEYLVDTNALVSAETVVDTITQQVEVEKGLLDSGSVTASTVILSMETLKNTMQILGVEDQVISISTEAMELDPVESLVISLEEKDTMLTKAIDLVKKLFKKIQATIKKYLTKAVVLYTGISKQAKVLADNIVRDGASGEFAIDEVTAGKIDNSCLGSFIKYYGDDVNFDSTLVKALSDFDKENIVAKTTSGLSVIKENLDKVYTSIKDGDSVSKPVVEAMLDSIATEYATVASESKLIVSYGIQSVRVLVASTPSVSNEDGSITKDRIVALLKDIRLESSALDLKIDLKITGISKSDMVKILGQVVESSDNTKKHFKNVEDQIASSADMVSNLSKIEDNSLYSPVVKFANTLISNVAMDYVLNRTKILKTTYSVCNEIYKSNSK